MNKILYTFLIYNYLYIPTSKIGIEYSLIKNIELIPTEPNKTKLIKTDRNHDLRSNNQCKSKTLIEYNII